MHQRQVVLAIQFITSLHFHFASPPALIMRDEIPRCTACTSLVKPNITFFGEQLPTRFHDCADLDVPHACDLLLVMGTSLAVQPFASLVDGVRAGVPRVLINRGHAGKVRFPRPRRKLDVAVEGDCDDGCWLLAELIGWRADLEELVEAGNSTHGDKRPRRMEKKQ